MEVLARERTHETARILRLLEQYDLLDELPLAVPREDHWAELCKWGAVAAGVLCATSTVAALILAYAQHV